MSVARLHRLGQGAFLKSSTTIVQVIAGLVVSVILNRVYSKETFGLLVLVYAVTGLAMVVSDLGGKITLIRFVPLWLQQKREGEAGNLFAAALVAQLVGIAAFSLLIFGLSRFLAESVFRLPTLAGLIQVGVVYFAAFALFDFFVQTFQSLQDWRREGLLNILFGLLQIVSVCIIGPILHAPIWWVLVGHAAAAFIAVAVALTWLPRDFWQALAHPNVGMVTQGFRTVVRFGLPLSSQGVYRYWISWFDKILLGRFDSPGNLALYYIASSFLNGLMALFKVLPAIFAPYIAEISEADLTGLRQKFQLIFRWLFQSAVLASLVVFFAVRPAVFVLYGPSYWSVVPLAHALLLVFLLRACRDPFGLFLTNAFSEVRTVFILGTIFSLSSVIGTAILVPLYGTWGAISASLLANVVTGGALLAMAPRLRAMVPHRTVWISLGSLSGIGAVYLLLGRTAIPDAVIGLGLLTLYVGALATFGEIGSEDVQLAREVFRANRDALARAGSRVAHYIKQPAIP